MKVADIYYNIWHNDTRHRALRTGTIAIGEGGLQLRFQEDGLQLQGVLASTCGVSSPLGTVPVRTVL
jgi:hypothetical protein